MKSKEKLSPLPGGKHLLTVRREKKLLQEETSSGSFHTSVYLVNYCLTDAVGEASFDISLLMSL